MYLGLRHEGVDGGVGVSVVHDHAQRGAVGHMLVEGPQVRLGRLVDHARTVVAIEEVGGGGHMQRFAYGRLVYLGSGRRRIGDVGTGWRRRCMLPLGPGQLGRSTWVRGAAQT